MPAEKVLLVDPRHLNATDRTFADRREALAFLKEASRNKENMAHFSRIWAGDGAKLKTLKPLTVTKMLNDLSEKLVKGKLRLGRKKVMLGSGGGLNREVVRPSIPKPMPTAKSVGIDRTYLKIRERPDPSPPPNPEPPVDIARQIQALKRAAEAGTPFCEQCQKLA